MTKALTKQDLNQAGGGESHYIMIGGILNRHMDEIVDELQVCHEPGS